MNERRDEEFTATQAAIPIPQDNITKGEELQRKLKDGEMKLNEAEKTAEEKISLAQQILALQGTAIEIAQKCSLLILAIQYLAISLLAMFILQLDKFGWILTWLPFLEQIVGSIYFFVLFIIEFFPNAVSQLPLNFLFFLLHSGSKVLLFVFVSLRYQNLKCELIFLTFGISILYLMYLIKSSVAHQQDDALKVRKQFLNITAMAGIISGFLCLLTRQNFFIIAILIIIGVLYICYLQLALQRFEQHEYIVQNRNDIYLGAAQIDADLFLICKLIAYHCFARQNQEGRENEIQKTDNTF